MVSDLLGRSNSANLVSVEVNGEIQTKPVDMAHYFVDYFESEVDVFKSLLS